MSAELLICCNNQTPETTSEQLLQKLASALKSSPSVGTNQGHQRFTFDELGIAVAFVPGDGDDQKVARVQVSDHTSIGHISSLFKTFMALGGL